MNDNIRRESFRVVRICGLVTVPHTYVLYGVAYQWNSIRQTLRKQTAAD